MSRTLVIGDIHGGLKALEQALTNAAVSTKDTLIFLGDYVDGWSESAQTIDYVMHIAEQQQCVFIKGNHDVLCEEWLRSGKQEANWLKHGGIATIESYTNIDNNTKLKHLEFLERMKLFYIDADNKLFLHAGFTCMHGPEQEFYSTNFTWDRTLWEMAITMDKRIKKDSVLFPKRLKLYKEIYIGHTPTTNYNVIVPMQGCNVWNIDTGAAFKGAISVMDVDTKQFWQSEPVIKLYPNEMGRNND
jgi:serine/threonine protein phosphatase 1